MDEITEQAVKERIVVDIERQLLDAWEDIAIGIDKFGGEISIKFSVDLEENDAGAVTVATKIAFTKDKYQRSYKSLVNVKQTGLFDNDARSDDIDLNDGADVPLIDEQKKIPYAPDGENYDGDLVDADFEEINEDGDEKITSINQ